MNKYDISRDDWNIPINILYNKIDLYSTQHTSIDDVCVWPLQSENYVSHIIVGSKVNMARCTYYARCICVTSAFFNLLSMSALNTVRVPH